MAALDPKQSVAGAAPACVREAGIDARNTYPDAGRSRQYRARRRGASNQETGMARISEVTTTAGTNVLACAARTGTDSTIATLQPNQTAFTTM
jgi:hypothetical protein